MIEYEGENCWYNFFILNTLYFKFTTDYNKVAVNLEEKDIYKMSYFVTSERVTEFAIDGKAMNECHDETFS